MNVVSVKQAKDLIHSGQEVAFLDVREAAAYGDGHALFAVHCPYSRLEETAIALVPREDVPVLLIDAGDGIAARAARQLSSCGFSDVRTVEGGMPAWARAGYGVFAGVNVPSKTLGEIAEHSLHPAVIDARTLSDWKTEARQFHFFDARPPTEYSKMRIPGARCLPNGELAHRFNAVVEDETTPVVITCAGRTRGIVGALGLRAAGIRNPVFALENGTQGWALADHELDRGATADPFPQLDAGDRAASRQRAERLAASGIPFISSAQASALLRENTHTTFLFDVRSSGESDERPCPGAVPVLAGQIVQATDQYVGVRHARLILVDDTGLRGALAALWLQALGFAPHVVALDMDNEIPRAVQRRLHLPNPPPRITAAGALDASEWAHTALIDLRFSADFERAHLCGAQWAIRPHLTTALPPGTTDAILYGDRAAVAGAASDLAERGVMTCWLAESLDDCAAAGWPRESAEPMRRDRAIDRVWFVHDRHDGNRESSLQYLSWEMGLIGQLDAAERAEFRAVALPD